MNKSKIRNNKWRISGTLVILALMAQAILPMLLPKALAVGSMTNTLVRFDRMATSTFTSGTVCAKPTSIATETSVKVTFPPGYTVSTTVGNWTTGVTTTGWPTGAVAWVGIGAPTGVGEFIISGQSVNFVSGDLTAGTLYCFNWTNNAAALQTKSSVTSNNAGQVITQTTGGTASDTGNFATATVANDQIAVSATVNASFSFSLSSNAAALGVLSAGGPSSASAINATVSTNASHGWQMWAADPGSPVGLHSTTASKTIAYSPAIGAAAAALSTGAEGFNLGAGTSSGTVCTSVTDDTNFASGGTSFKGGGLDGTLRSLAVSTGVADTCALPLTVNASISNTTPAASDYAALMTVVAAGNF